MVAAVTNGIKVTVFTEYQPFHSDPLRSHYVFSYRIRIENSSDFTFQLKSRHWYIFDSLGVNYEVVGDGVVGIQPIIEPGEYHEYVSGCNFNSTIGKMHGKFFIEKVIDGKKLEITIPEFLMIVPFILN
jgi:ApaG protein